MRSPFLALVVCSCVLPAAVRPGCRAEYIGGTVAQIPIDNSGDIGLTDQTYFVFLSKRTQVKIPYERIDLLEYGQKVDRRYLTAALISPLFLLSKKRQHFLTIGYQDDDGHQQALIFRVNKNDIRTALVALEARTGKRIEYQDDDARIAGKG
jgi:hypothetical protein